MKTIIRCDWCGDDPEYIRYHDRVWGKPVHNDRKLFEYLILEGAQAGLSWITILKRQKNYQQAFDKFDFNKIALYEQQKIDALLNNAGIIRNRLKIQSVVSNAKAFIQVRKEFGTFNRYLWAYVDNEPIVNSWTTLAEVPAKTELSDQISKDLKKRGFKFIGSTICYAYMQAIGMVNDHLIDCSFRNAG